MGSYKDKAWVNSFGGGHMLHVQACFIIHSNIYRYKYAESELNYTALVQWNRIQACEFHLQKFKWYGVSIANCLHTDFNGLAW